MPYHRPAGIFVLLVIRFTICQTVQFCAISCMILVLLENKDETEE